MTTILWLACFLAAGGQASVARYRIAGAIVNTATSQPVAGARVTLASHGQPIEAVTGEDGHFAFPALDRGKYELSAVRRGFLASNVVIVTGPDLNTENVVVPLSPPAVISGKVMDDAGEPIAQALVQLLRSRIVDGRRQLTEDSTKRTDDIGEYRFSALAPGSYYLVVSAVPWYAKFNETVGDRAPAGMTHAGYAIRYYPNVAEPAAAEPLVLKAGQDATANFTLFSVPSAPVFVHCESEEDLTKHYTLTAAGLPGNPVTVRQGSAAGDLYNLWSVPPGRYTLRVEATDGHRTWYGASEVDVASAENDVDLTLQPAPSLNGIVLADSGSLPAELTILLRNESGPSVSLPIGPDGRFSSPAIPPGRYRISLAGTDEYYLRNHSGDALDIQPGAAVKLSLQVARATGSVAGAVYRNDQPLPGVLVVLSPANRATQTSNDGSYEFRGVPPGEYSLFAVENGADLEYANPAAIRPYLDRAKKVQVGTGNVAQPLVAAATALLP